MCRVWGLSDSGLGQIFKRGVPVCRDAACCVSTVGVVGGAEKKNFPLQFKKKSYICFCIAVVRDGIIYLESTL